MHNKSWKRALHARQSKSKEWLNDNELHELQQCKFEDDCKQRWHVARKQRRKITTLMQWWREDSWYYWFINKDINVREKDEQRLLMKRNNIEADVSSSTRFRRKTSHDSNAFITKNVQKLKTSVQLLSKQLQMQKNTSFSSKIMSWTNVTREELLMRKQHFKEKSSSLCKRCKVMIKIADREEIEKMQKKIIKQILQKIADMSMSQWNLIMFLCKLSSKDIFLHAISSNA